MIWPANLNWTHVITFFFFILFTEDLEKSSERIPHFLRFIVSCVHY